MPLAIIGDGMDIVLTFQPKGNLVLGVNELLTNIPRPRDVLEYLDIDVEFEPLIVNMAILLVVGLEPPPNVNRGTKVDNFEAPMLDVLKFVNRRI